MERKMFTLAAVARQSSSAQIGYDGRKNVARHFLSLASIAEI